MKEGLTIQTGLQRNKITLLVIFHLVHKLTEIPLIFKCNADLLTLVKQIRLRTVRQHFLIHLQMVPRHKDATPFLDNIINHKSTGGPLQRTWNRMGLSKEDHAMRGNIQRKCFSSWEIF